MAQWPAWVGNRQPHPSMWSASHHSSFTHRCILSFQATVISASGVVHTASATVNPDLFFGIRGAGGNFGVVTEFVYQLHPQRAKVFAGMLFYPLPALEEVVGVTREWASDSLDSKAGMAQAFTIGPDGNVRSNPFL